MYILPQGDTQGKKLTNKAWTCVTKLDVGIKHEWLATKLEYLLGKLSHPHNCQQTILLHRNVLQLNLFEP